MGVEYLESSRIWKRLGQSIKCAGLGQAILEKLMQDDPNRILEVYCSKGIQLRVRDVLEQTIAAARMLLDNGLQKGDVVVLYSMVNEKVTPLTFACYTIGAPVNFFETKFEEDEIKQGLEILQPAAIIYEGEYEDRLFAALGQMKLPTLKMTLNMDADLLLSGIVDIDTFQVPDIGDPEELAATVVFTSGSTGFPKVIQHSHAMMMRGLYTWWKPTPGRIFCFSPLRWMSQVSFMMHPVFFGAQRMYASSPPSGTLGREIVDKFKVTHYFSVPGAYLDMLNAAIKSGDPSSLSSLRVALIGGETISESLVELSAQVAPRCRLIKCYGMTEMAGGVASDEEIDRREVRARTAGGVLHCGFAAKILDEHDQPLGPNQNGRLFVKSTVPFLGYLRNEKANRETFVDGGWCDTGDYACMDSDRLLNIFTRYKNLVRSGDTVVIPNRVEDPINNHPAVLISAFVGHPDKENETDEVGTLFVVPQKACPQHKLERELRDLLSRTLPKDELRVVKFIRVIDEMPRTSCGKIDRMTLKNMAREL